MSLPQEKQPYVIAQHKTPDKTITCPLSRQRVEDKELINPAV